MFDWFFEGIAQTLNFFYDLIPDYAIAIALLTLVIMIVTTPFTLKGTRSMIQMQILQPEMRRLQLQYKDDRQKLNEELMAFYKENNLNPLGGCLPMLLQAPIFIVLYQVIRGLTRRSGETFDPKYLDESGALYQALHGAREMMSFGVDLSESASAALSEGFLHGLPHVVLVAIVAVSSYLQQRQIQSRNPNADIPPQQKMLMRIFPLMIVVVSFVSPAAIVIYFVASNVYRIGVQHYITRSLYHGEDSLGAKAQAASAEARRLHKESGQRSEAIPRLTRKAREGGDAKTASTKPPASKGGAAAATGAKASGARPSNGPRPTTRTRGSTPNRSKKKRKRR